MTAPLPQGAVRRGAWQVVAARPTRASGGARTTRPSPGEAVVGPSTVVTTAAVAKGKPASTVSGEQSDRQRSAGASRPTGRQLAASTDADSAQLRSEVRAAAITAAGRRQVFGAETFRIVPRLQKPALGVGAHSRLVLFSNDISVARRFRNT